MCVCECVCEGDLTYAFLEAATAAGAVTAAAAEAAEAAEAADSAMAASPADSAMAADSAMVAAKVAESAAALEIHTAANKVCSAAFANLICVNSPKDLFAISVTCDSIEASFEAKQIHSLRS